MGKICFLAVLCGLFSLARADSVLPFSISPPAEKWSIQPAQSPDVQPAEDQWKDLAAFDNPLRFLPNSPKAPLYNVWYRTTFKVPAEAADRSVWLRFQHIRGIARVYVNGTFIKELVRPDWEADITPAVKPGEDAQLLLYVTRTGQGTTAKFEDDIIEAPAMQKFYRQPYPDTVGLMGKVEVLLRGRQSQINSAWVESVWDPKTLRVHVQTGGAANPDLRIIGQVMDASGKVALELPAVPFQPGDVTLSVPWPGVVPWELGQGILYSLRLRMVDKDEKVMDELDPISFGFRELKVDGRQFLMNGRPITWRFSPTIRIDGVKSTDFDPARKTALDFLRSVGFNVLSVQPQPDMWWNRYNGPWPIYPDDILDQFDQWGMGMSISAPQFTKQWLALGVERNPAVAAQYRKELEAFMAPYRNHPSILTWVGSMNYFDQDYGRVHQHAASHGHGAGRAGKESPGLPRHSWREHRDRGSRSHAALLSASRGQCRHDFHQQPIPGPDRGGGVRALAIALGEGGTKAVDRDRIRRSLLG